MLWPQHREAAERNAPGEEGGEGKVAHSRRGRVTARGEQMEEEKGLFPSLIGPSLRPEGNFKSSGSSRDNMAVGGDSAYLRGESAAVNPCRCSQLCFTTKTLTQSDPLCLSCVFTAPPPAGQKPPNSQCHHPLE